MNFVGMTSINLQNVFGKAKTELVIPYFEAKPIFFPRIYDSYYNRIHFSLTTVHFWDSSQWLGKNIVWNTG